VRRKAKTILSIHGPDKIKGRGIVYINQDTAESLVPGSKFVGYHNYKMTLKAFRSLCESMEVGIECSLD
jgi:hypothetical protein